MLTLCLTRVLALWPRCMRTTINSIVSSCLFRVERKKKNAHLFCTKQCARIQWRQPLFILNLSVMESHGELTYTPSTNLLHHLPSLTQLMSKKLQSLRLSVSLRVRFTCKCQKGNQVLKTWLDSFLTINRKEEEHKKWMQKSYFFITIKT